ncbi:intra-flagellar transport protein 57 [Globomyces pollinis-pini]|nr:intra-flagellar transport protein 57 [Globomyces pollinis-pini]
MSAKDSGSNESIANVGRSSSRGSLAAANANMDDILDKLKCLNYQKDFCLPNNLLPINRFYFLYASSNPNEQFYNFTSLFTWLLKMIGIQFDKPGQFDDPNATCTNIVGELKRLGIPFEFGPSKLKQGYGEGCIYILQCLVDMAIIHQKIVFHSPIHKVDDYPEEAEVDYDAEVTTETVEGVEANPEDDEMFMDTLNLNRKSESIDLSVIAPKTDPAEWRLEVERIAPLLKLQLPNDNKDWRLHLQQMEHHQKNISNGMTKTQSQLSKLHGEIEQTLENIASREKYINAQFETQIDQYKRVQEQCSEAKQKHSIASSNVTELTNELSKVSEELDSVKSRMDDLGNGMTDSKPLIAIKQGVTKLKAEIKQMNLRIGVIENTLLNAKLKGKGTSSDFSVQVLSFY